MDHYTPDKKEIREWTKELSLKPLSPDDHRYVPLEKVLIDGEEVNLRGDDVIRTLYNLIDSCEAPTCQLFSGYSGTGKSTELFRLKQMLENNGDHIVLLVDVAEYHDLSHPLAIEDITVILAGAFGEAAAGVLGSNVIGESYWERFVRFLQTELEIKEVRLKASFLDIKATVRNGDAPFWDRAREKLSTDMRTLKNDAHAFIGKCLEKIKKRYPDKEVVFILDSLEKLQAREPNFREIVDSVVKVFSQHYDILHLPDCHVIYTVPPYAGLETANIALHYNRQLIKPLPAIKVAQKVSAALQPAPTGIKGLTLLLEKRLPLEKVFGNRIDLLEEMILYSGGHVRFLLGMVLDMIIRNSGNAFPPEASLVKKLLQDFKENRTRTIRPEDVPILYRIHKKHGIDEVTREELPLLARFLDNSQVLCYQNGEGWYEVHPLIRDDIIARTEEG